MFRIAALMVVMAVCNRAGLAVAQDEGPARKPAEEIKAEQANPRKGEPGARTMTPSGAESKPPTAQTHPNNPELWNTEQMMEDAVLQISRRYNLNKAQEEYTRLLLTNRVRAFLDVYESDIRELLRESIDLRMGLKPGSGEAFQRWAERAAPIYEAAQKAILEGNSEWGAILDEAQTKQHEADLSAMHSNFAQVTRMLDAWKSGQGPIAVAAATKPPTQGDQASSGGLGPGADQPQHQARVSDPVQPIVQQQVEDTWLAYVNRFIRTYKLDERQAISARDRIYKDVRDQATKYREKHKKDFAALDAAKASDKAGMDPATLQKRQSDLERPLGDLFVTLDKRLKTLPDGKQLAAADPADVKQLEAMFKLLAGQFSKTQDKTRPDPKEGPQRASPVTSRPVAPPAGAKTPASNSGERADSTDAERSRKNPPAEKSGDKSDDNSGDS